MRVIARKVDISKCPENLRTYLGQVFVTQGKNYDIYAVALFEAVLFGQLIDDLGNPSWWPFWLFDVTDPSIPREWICSVFHDEPVLVLGPEFVAGSQAKYSAMVEQEPAQVDLFWAYVNAHATQTAD